MSDVDETPHDYNSSEVGIFESRLVKRKEAVLNRKKYEEYVVAELQRQEQLENEAVEEKKTAGKKRLKPKKTSKKKLPLRKSNKTNYYESSGSEKLDSDVNISNEKTNEKCLSPVASSEIGIFESCLEKRKAAVLSLKKYEEYVAETLEEQEQLENEREVKKKTTAAKKNKSKSKKAVKKRSLRKGNKTNYYESSGSEKSDNDVNIPGEKCPSSIIIVSSDEELCEIDVNSEIKSSENFTDSPNLQLSPPPTKKQRQRKNKRLKEIAAFSLEDGDSDCLLICDDLIVSDPCEEINLKIWCNGKILHKKMKSSSTFSEVFQYISEESNVPISDVLIYFNDVAVNVEDTPEKLGINMADILNSVIVSSDVTVGKNKNCIEIKFQTKDSKTKTVMSVHKIEPLQKPMQKFADDKGLTLKSLTFEFDGDKIFPEQTPIELDLDDGCVIDVKILK